MYDTLIIGAGMSALAAGIRLAHFGQRVCILERHTTIGGLNSFYRLGGRNYDVGLHAVTNYAPGGDRHRPLARLLRQLRLSLDELALRPQIGSAVAFPGVRLEFSNDFALFESEVRRHFPGQVDKLRRLVSQTVDYDQIEASTAGLSAREVVGRIIDDPLLLEMLFCPILFYGGAREHDVEFGQFSIMFRSIFLEGLARPFAGVRPILKVLVRKYKALGGELRLRAGVARIVVRNGRAEKVLLEDGSELSARRIVSSAGRLETMRLLDAPDPLAPSRGSRISFVESISFLNRQPRDVGFDRAIVFFNDAPRFRYAVPEGPVDLHSGVICSPNNYFYEEPLAEGVVRLTALANYGYWKDLPEEEYRLEKLRWYDRLAASAVRFMPDFRGLVIDTDLFTPRTIERFTGHTGGAVYGDPQKHRDGTTPVKNLFLCGNDQGLVGIVGTLLSGIGVANRHLLKD